MSFADGSEAQVLAEDVLPPRFAKVRLGDLTSTPEHLVIPTPDPPDGAIEIPWDVIRRATDPEYAAHWEALAIASEKRLGRRLKTLRESRSLSREELAARLHLAPELIERIEQGDPEVYGHTAAILEALDYNRDALFRQPRKTPRSKLAS